MTIMLIETANIVGSLQTNTHALFGGLAGVAVVLAFAALGIWCLLTGNLRYSWRHYLYGIISLAIAFGFAVYFLRS